VNENVAPEPMEIEALDILASKIPGVKRYRVAEPEMALVSFDLNVKVGFVPALRATVESGVTSENEASKATGSAAETHSSHSEPSLQLNLRRSEYVLPESVRAEKVTLYWDPAVTPESAVPVITLLV